MIIDLDTKAAQMREEVIFSRVSNVGLDSDVIDQLCSMAAKTSRGRVRLCVHRDSSEEQQEMLIVHPRHAYVPPHKHLGKSESILILRGSVLQLQAEYNFRSMFINIKHGLKLL